MLSFQQGSPRDIALPSSPEPLVSMSVSITTPGSQIPSIHSQLATIISEPPRKILTHDVNKLLSYLHDTNTARDAQHAELTDHLRAIKDELLGKIEDMLQELLNRAAVPPPVPPLHQQSLRWKRVPLSCHQASSANASKLSYGGTENRSHRFTSQLPFASVGQKTSSPISRPRRYPQLHLSHLHLLCHLCTTPLLSHREVPAPGLTFHLVPCRYPSLSRRGQYTGGVANPGSGVRESPSRPCP